MGRVRGGHLLPRRRHDVRQLLHAGNDVRGDGALAQVGPLRREADPRLPAHDRGTTGPEGTPRGQEETPRPERTAPRPRGRDGRPNPSGCRINAFKAPTHEERRHPFLWRARQALPHPGELGIFDRSLPHFSTAPEAGGPPSRTS
ncbi:hypothetical protein [Streptomyces sp. NBC_00124]|uniref:hypothetical protein n=1 Tax=Streptomyces sp. NBC_00124 TaxID=2975662 RepID=UPI002B1E6EE0|nr:hypothetical protein [Streptomyces sp. NBC_00124]